jgi:hypothetical protein
MRKLVYVSSTILFSLLISGCFHDDDNDNPQPINNENYAGIWVGEFGSDIVDDGAVGLFSIANNGETYFTSEGNGSIAFTATYEEKLASEIYDAQEIVDFLGVPASGLCEDYVDAGYITDCSDITAANVDAILGPVLQGTDINWYQAGVKLESDPVLGTLERVSEAPEVPMHLGFAIDLLAETNLSFGEIDQALLTPSTSLGEAIIGAGGGEFILPSSDAPVLLSALAGNWAAIDKPAGIEIEADGSFIGSDISECIYAGQITEREKDAYIFDATLTVDCGGSVFDGAYTGVVAFSDNPGLEFIQLVVTTGDGEYMISQEFEEFEEMIL